MLISNLNNSIEIKHLADLHRFPDVGKEVEQTHEYK